MILSEVSMNNKYDGMPQLLYPKFSILIFIVDDEINQTMNKISEFTNSIDDELDILLFCSSDVTHEKIKNIPTLHNGKAISCSLKFDVHLILQ